MEEKKPIYWQELLEVINANQGKGWLKLFHFSLPSDGFFETWRVSGCSDKTIRLQKKSWFGWEMAAVIEPATAPGQPENYVHLAIKGGDVNKETVAIDHYYPTFWSRYFGFTAEIYPGE